MKKVILSICIISCLTVQAADQQAVLQQLEGVTAAPVDQGFAPAGSYLRTFGAYTSRMIQYGLSSVGLAALGARYFSFEFGLERDLTPVLVGAGFAGAGVGAYVASSEQSARLARSQRETDQRQSVENANAGLREAARRIVDQQGTVRCANAERDRAKVELQAANQRVTALTEQVGTLSQRVTELSRATEGGFTNLRRDMQVRDQQDLLALLGIWNEQIANTKALLQLQIATARVVSAEADSIENAVERFATLEQQQQTLDGIMRAQRALLEDVPRAE